LGLGGLVGGTPEGVGRRAGRAVVERTGPGLLLRGRGGGGGTVTGLEFLISGSRHWRRSSNADPGAALAPAVVTVFRDITFLAAGPASKRSRSAANVESWHALVHRPSLQRAAPDRPYARRAARRGWGAARALRS